MLFLTCVQAKADVKINAVGCLSLSDFSTGYGPYDYTNPEHIREKLPVVERHHFSTNVELLISGDSSHNPWDDLVFIVRAFPNHHRALSTMVRYKIANKPLPDEAEKIECHFARAFEFMPDDARLHLIYTQYLHKSGEQESALALYKKHEKIKPESVERDYNLGLLYFEMKDYKNAKIYADKVYRRGYPFTELKEKLISVGHWTAKEE